MNPRCVSITFTVIQGYTYTSRTGASLVDVIIVRHVDDSATDNEQYFLVIKELTEGDNLS